MSRKDRAERKDADSKAYQRRMGPLAKRMEKSRKGASERLVSRWDSLLSDLGYTAGMSREAAGAWLLQGVPSKVKRNIRRMSLLAPKVTDDIEKRLEGPYTVRKAIHDVGRIETSRSTETLRDDVREPLENTAREANSRATFGIQKELGFGARYEPFEDGVYTKIANRQASYTRMNSYLARTMTEPMEKALVDGVRDGLGASQIARNMRAASDDVPPYIAKMVARTMITETAADSEAETLEETGSDEYEFQAGLDERTCDICGMLDGKKFKLSEREAGVNCPPMHLNCRCTISAVLDPEFVRAAKRSARNGDGSTYRVPASMTYTEWRESLGKPFTPPEKVPEHKKTVEPAPEPVTAKARREATYTVDAEQERVRELNIKLELSGNSVRRQRLEEMYSAKEVTGEQYDSILKALNDYDVHIQAGGQAKQLTEILSGEVSLDTTGLNITKLEMGVWNGRYASVENDPALHLRKNATDAHVKYNPVKLNDRELTEQEIVKKIAGGDKTTGSCVSQAFTYIANKAGLDVTDFRGGDSCELFSGGGWRRLLEAGGPDKVVSHFGVKEIKAALETVEMGKEYVLVAGQHCSVIRLTEKGYEYLELQSRNPEWNGWRPMGKEWADIKTTLSRRFAYRQPVTGGLCDIEAIKSNEDLLQNIGYINTDPSESLRGIGGGIK